MPKEHDDRVLEVAETLASLGTVHVDLPREYASKHAFEAKQILPDGPTLMLAALVPTQAVFTKRGVLLNAHWKEPDLVLVREGYRYVVDVHDDNDTFSSVARKVESIIFSAREWNVVGVAMVAKGHEKPYAGKLAELEALRATFWKVVATEPIVGAESVVTYLDALMRLPQVASVYGKPDWARVLEVRAAEGSWKEGLVAHARKALDSRRVMVTA